MRNRGLYRIAQWGAPQFELLATRYKDDQIREDKNDGAYSTDERQERFLQNFGRNCLKQMSSRCMDLIEVDESMWIGFMWLTIGTISGLLCTL
jgi:hypothetical protein